MKIHFIKGSNNGYFTVFFLLIIVFYLTAEISFIQTQSATADEGAHMKYGIRIIKGSSHKYSCTPDDSKMPISVLNVIPRAVQQYFNPDLKKSDYGKSDITMGRYITLCISLISLLIVFLWSAELYGPWAGLISMALLAFCPNWLAHSGLVTTDAYATTIFLMVFYFLYKYVTTKRFIFFVSFCFCVGLSQIIKQTFIYLYICLLLLLLVYALFKRPKVTLYSLIKHTSLFIVINLLIINAGFLFFETGLAFKDYHFVSSMFSMLQQKMGFLGEIPLPLPSPFLVGLDTVKFFDEYGGGMPASTFPTVAILNQHQPGESYWYFYLISFIFKTPIPTIIFFSIALIQIFSRKNRLTLVREEIFLLLPLLFFAITMSFFNRIQSGIRHIIFLYPLIYVVCGKTCRAELIGKYRTVFACLAIWLISSVCFYFNSYLSYTNELIPNKKMAYLIVSPVNIDYGQSGYYTEEYLKNNPLVTYAPKTPAKGTFLISAMDYTDGFNLHEYEWIQKYKPVGHVHFTHLIIKVP